MATTTVQSNAANEKHTVQVVIVQCIGTLQITDGDDRSVEILVSGKGVVVELFVFLKDASLFI
jgi:hypothetical protein